MDYTPPDIVVVDEGPDLCIRSLVEYKPGYYMLDMPSRYDPAPQPIVEIDESTRETIQEYYEIPFCPPGWPNPPEEEEVVSKQLIKEETGDECMDYLSARLGVKRAEKFCLEEHTGRNFQWREPK